MTKAVAFSALLLGAAACAGSRAGGGVSPGSPARGGPPDPWFAAVPNDARIADVAPGRFAVTYDYHGMASCSMSWGSTTSRATVVLNLAADGTATGCRGRNYFNVVGSNDEFVAIRRGLPHRPPEQTRRTEQQGMRGRWQRDGQAIVLDLVPDAGVCPTRATGETSKPWHLRCAFIQPTAGGATVREPVLACAWRTESAERAMALGNWDLQAGYVTSQVIPGYWVILAPGAGLRLTERKIGAALYGDSDLSWQPAAAPIAFDDWATPAF